LREGLAANTIQSIYGIINGTANYILSRMTHEGRSFETVLDEAKQAGYAEADPTFDVAGIDSAHKLAIMVALAYGTPVNFKDVYTEGITHITPLDIAYAKEFGYTIKLLGIAKLVGNEVEARVHPTMLPSSSPIAQVEGVYNAIQLVGDAVGDVVLYGRGAGSMPTGSAVVSDLIAIARNLLKGAVGRVPPASFQQDQRRPLRMRQMEEISSLYYLRFMVLDRPGVLSQIAGEWAGAVSVSRPFSNRAARRADGSGRDQDPYRHGARCPSGVASNQSHGLYLRAHHLDQGRGQGRVMP
jgi:Homoserine dehydrogenase